jgi:membrane protein required for colicin V production
MPITLLDIILLAVMLISGLLAMIRGFMREVLSIAAWIAAALATLYLFNRLVPYAQQYFNNDVVAKAAVIGGVFLGTLLIVSVITVRISDMILDSRIGALDRTLGFLYGAARGVLVVAVALLFFNWLVGTKPPTWVAEAKSRPMLESIGQWIESKLPADPENAILKRLAPGETPEGSQADGPAEAPPADAPPATESAPADNN